MAPRSILALLLLPFARLLGAAELPPLGDRVPELAAALGHGAVAAPGGAPKKKIAVGMILAEAWRVYGPNFGRIAVIIAVIWAPLELLSRVAQVFQ